MNTVKFLQDISVYNSITAVSGITAHDLLVIGTSNIPDVTILKSASADWGSTTTTVNSNSANWDSVYNTFKSTSASPSFDTITVTYSSVLGNVVGIGTVVPDTTKALHVSGDVLIQGNLSANGTLTFTNTIFNTTSALSVLNTGTGPALVVTQTGEEAVAAFYDDSNIALYIDGKTATAGNVGVGTKTPNATLTVVGDISATGTIYGTSTIQKFVSAFGDGASQVFVIDHNLGNRNVIPSVMDNATYEIVVPSLVLTTANSITIETATVPGVSAYTLTVIG